MPSKELVRDERILGMISTGLNAFSMGLSFFGPEGKVAAAGISLLAGGIRATDIELEYSHNQINRTTMAAEETLNAIQTVGSVVGFGFAAKKDFEARNEEKALFPYAKKLDDLKNLKTKVDDALSQAKEKKYNYHAEQKLD
jgi:hypothetical protein